MTISSKHIIIGIDDTDNLESRGTGHLARTLADSLYDTGLAEPLNITRHQLLVNPAIPYTSHNSSASIVCKPAADLEKIIFHCRSYLLEHAAEGSDAGLCVLRGCRINDDIIKWGARAKTEVLKAAEAKRIAKRYAVFLEGLTGTKIGVIGSLAAAGLRAAGNDGRILWLKNLRELKGVYYISDLYQLLSVDRITDKNGKSLPAHLQIDVGEWCRPVLMNQKITLIAEEKGNDGQSKWTIASKDYIKSLTE
jgi:hypothetical protein